MARMYSRKKGQSGSKKPIKKQQHSWIRYKPKEIELLIIKLAREGRTSSEIGTILRDTYGVPDVRTVAGKKITQILEEKKLLSKLPEDLMALIKKVVAVKAHMELNKKDQTAKRGIMLTESKIKRLIKYYKRVGKLPEDWKYDPKQAKMYLE